MPSGCIPARSLAGGPPGLNHPGAPGTGKSVALRLLDTQLCRLRDVKVRSLTHPQSGVADFYRELGHCFAVPLSPHNRWNGFKQLRETWQAYIDSTLVRPVLFLEPATPDELAACLRHVLVAAGNASLMTADVITEAQARDLAAQASALALAASWPRNL